MMRFSRYTLPLADGMTVGLRAGDEPSSRFLDRFARAAELSREEGGRRDFSIRLESSKEKTDTADPRVCRLVPVASLSEFFCQAVALTMAVGRRVQKHGGVFLHGALAEFQGRGVVLAAPGGTGKTTASARLPSPWRSLSDDMALLVRDRSGNIWAHPWPTLSRFLEGGPGGTWGTSRAVPVAAVFFLLQAPAESVNRVGPGEGLALLVESAEQASQTMARGLDPEARRVLRRERFDNLAAIARTVPVHFLRLSLNGAFWKEIEESLGPGRNQISVRPGHEI